MAERYLIDTSAAIKYLNNSLPEAAITFLDAKLDEESNISFITKIELLVWDTSNSSNIQILQKFIDNSVVFPIDNSLIENTIEIRKRTKIKLPDALIAATTLVHNFTLLADNDKDFNKVLALDIGFKYVNVNNLISH